MQIRFVWLLMSIVALPAHADLLASQGAKGTLSVEYVYESAGKTQDVNDLHEWRVNRTVKMSADMVAEGVQPLPSMQALDAAQSADLKNKQSHAMSAAQNMAPMMGDVQAIVAKCGEDEACIEQAIAKYGASMQMTPELEAAGKDIAEVSKQGAPRYQMWRATAQKGTYSIDEAAHRLDADPICRELRCTSDQTRKGSGEVPPAPSAKTDANAAAGVAMLEVDSTGRTMTLQLPVPLNALPYTQTLTTNNPEQRGGTTQALLAFPPTGKPLQVALRGATLDQSGESVTRIAGTAGEGGALTVRWRFTAK
jgi:hypothetical protein